MHACELVVQSDGCNHPVVFFPLRTWSLFLPLLGFRILVNPCCNSCCDHHVNKILQHFWKFGDTVHLEFFCDQFKSLKTHGNRILAHGNTTWLWQTTAKSFPLRLTTQKVRSAGNDRMLTIGSRRMWRMTYI